MINLNFYLRNPWSERFSRVRLWSGRTPFPNKAWELEVFRSSDLVGLAVNFDTCVDHAGLRLCMALLTWNLEFTFYDIRHWDYESDDWYKL